MHPFEKSPRKYLYIQILVGRYLFRVRPSSEYATRSVTCCECLRHKAVLPFAMGFLYDAVNVFEDIRIQKGKEGTRDIIFAPVNDDLQSLVALEFAVKYPCDR